MPANFNLIKKPLGKVLEEAGLITEAQLQVVLSEQNIYPDLKIGEILALHHWIKQETADFFAEKMRQIIQEENRRLQIGNFFNQARLLSQNDIQNILNEQKKTGIKFGATAVLKGFIKQQTLDFYLKYFTLETNKRTDFQYKDESTLTQKRFCLQTQNNQANAKKVAVKSQALSAKLSKYYNGAMESLAKARSGSTQLEKVNYLKDFLKYYQKIEQLQMQNDPCLEKLPIQAQNRLDRIYVGILAQLERLEKSYKLLS